MTDSRTAESAPAEGAVRRREGYHWGPREWRPSDVQERILDGVSRGLTNPEIAREVGISADGVKWHISRALAETGLRDRQSLGRWWQSGPLNMSLATGLRAMHGGAGLRRGHVPPVELMLRRPGTAAHGGAPPLRLLAWDQGAAEREEVAAATARTEE